MEGEGAGGETLARLVVARLRAAGHQAYLVGGCVRDLLLGLAPGDWDVATGALPGEVLSLFAGAQLVGAHFGVVLVPGENAHVQVATFRNDHSYLDGRRPTEVSFLSDPREDALRRDFTINALFLDPDSGEVLDYAGGREDLQRGVIRAIGDPETRFGEDHLRMLRAVRFAARLGFTIEQGTMSAIGRLKSLVLNVSAERIRDELLRILTEGGARRGFELLDATGLLDVLLPEVAAMKGVEQPPEFHPEGDVWTHTLMMLDLMREPTPALSLGVLLHDVGKPSTFERRDRIRFDYHAEAGAKMAAAILTRLKCSNDTIRTVEELVANHLRFKDVPRMRESKLRRFLRMDHFEEHLELHRLDCLASHGMLDHYEFVKAKLAELPAEVLRPRRLLTGHDLIRAGYLPGPAFQAMLETAEDAQLESRVRTPEEALSLILSLFEPPAGRPRQAGK